MKPAEFSASQIHKKHAFLTRPLIPAALMFCIGLQFAFSIWVGSSILAFPYGADYGEAPLAAQAKRITEGTPLYKMPLDTPPYIISNYPPIYPALLAGISWLTGAALLQTGRAISLAAALICTGVLGWIVWRLSGQCLAVIVAAGLFLGNPYVTLWGSLARVDMLALMFSLLALGGCLHWRNSWRGIWLISLCLVAAVYTRQTYLLAAPLACCVYLWSREKKHALGLALLFAGQALGIFALLNGITQGGFNTHIVQANLNTYEVGRTLLMMRQFLMIWPVVVGIAFWLVLKTAARLLPGRPSGAFGDPFLLYALPIYTLLAFISSLTVGKVGSNVNYFLELVAALTIWAGLAVGRIGTAARRQEGVLTLLVGQALWVLTVNWGLYRPAIQNLRDSLDRTHQLYQQVQAAVAQGPVLADDHLSLVLMTGQPIYYQPFEYGQLYQAGLWDPRPFAEELRQRKFPLILIAGDTLEKRCCWPPETIAAIREQYDIVQKPRVLICTPKRK